MKHVRKQALRVFTVALFSVARFTVARFTATLFTVALALIVSSTLSARAGEDRCIAVAQLGNAAMRPTPAPSSSPP